MKIFATKITHSAAVRSPQILVAVTRSNKCFPNTHVKSSTAASPQRSAALTDPKQSGTAPLPGDESTPPPEAAPEGDSQSQLSPVSGRGPGWSAGSLGAWLGFNTTLSTPTSRIPVHEPLSLNILPSPSCSTSPPRQCPHSSRHLKTQRFLSGVPFLELAQTPVLRQHLTLHCRHLPSPGLPTPGQDRVFHLPTSTLRSPRESSINKSQSCADS